MKKGRRRWPHLHYVQDFFKSQMEDQRLPDYAREWYKEIYYRLLWHEHDIEDVIEVLLEEKERSPSFPDDFGVWLHDNFDDEDEDEADDKTE